MKKKRDDSILLPLKIVHVMKITLMLVLVGIIQVSATTYAQEHRISVHVKNGTFYDVVSQIEKQSEFMFFYKSEEIKGVQRINLNVKDKLVSEILNEITKNNNLSYKITGKHIIITKITTDFQNQISRKITGTVTDENGEPIIGANVVEKGTTNGTVTDIEGRFMLNVANNAILQISYIGYNAQDVKTTAKSSYSIVLKEDAEILDEVIVIGYGTAKRKDFTGSVSSVKLENSPVALTPNLNALESLKGNISGLNVGASNTAGGSPSLQIRGQNSISGSNDPLIVLDGVVYLGSIRDINPNDIATIDVLNDATSAAAYGSRSANGVVAITTKKGTSEKPVISFNANVAAQTWQRRPEVMDAEQWFASVNERNGYEIGETSWLRKGQLENRELGKATDWLDLSTRVGSIQDYQVSISGSAPKVNYYLSTSYSDNAGIVVGDDFDRFSMLGKMKTNVTNWLEVGVDAAYSRSDYSGNAANISEAYKMSPYGVNYRDEENKLIEKYPTGQSHGHPLWGVDDDTRYNSDIRNNYRLGVNVLVKIPWIKGLTYRMNYMGNWELSTGKNFITERSYVLEGDYDDISRYSPATYESFLSKANGNETITKINSYVLDNILNYTNTFGKHSIDVTLVATQDLRESEKVVNQGSDYSMIGNTNLGIFGLNKAAIQVITQTNDRRANIGYMGRVNYAFDDKYFVTGSFRRDGASVFGANNKWANFGAFGLAWRISKENFMTNVENMDDLKLKVSWGQNGNQGIGPYTTLSQISNGQSSGIRYEFSDTGDKIHYGLIQSNLGNYDLGWESTESWNFGIESSWFKNRLGVDLDIYKSKTTEQLFTRNIPVMSGFKTIKTSMGQVNNTGIEATVRTVNIQNKDWHWSTSFTFWKNLNKLVHLYGEDLDGDGREDDDVASSLFIGKSLGAIYGYKQIGIVQENDVEYMELTGAKPGAPMYEDVDGVPGISANDRQILGYNKENFKLNMSNTVSYKNLELYIMITGTFGGNNHYLKSNKGAYITKTGRFDDNGIYIPHWTPENKSNEYPGIDFTDDGRFLGLQNRGFVRLQDITLSYTFNQPWMKKVLMRSLKVFCSAQNILTITSWKGGDPETGATVWDNTYPVPTTFSLGANISF
ncbi:TonB-dependent receptor [Parabacteroides johnsonii]|uniref:TonB-dependent receptor n=1 Tax=Parabacteroides johnsonii TaxID=387661 RepID=UPI001898E37A|nr:TonB-dependent receptor [Parabacteroides johnsonii]